MEGRCLFQLTTVLALLKLTTALVDGEISQCPQDGSKAELEDTLRSFVTCKLNSSSANLFHQQIQAKHGQQEDPGRLVVGVTFCESTKMSRYMHFVVVGYYYYYVFCSSVFPLTFCLEVFYHVAYIFQQLISKVRCRTSCVNATAEDITWCVNIPYADDVVETCVRPGPTPGSIVSNSSCAAQLINIERFLSLPEVGEHYTH